MTTLRSSRREFWKRISDRESKRAKRGWMERHKRLQEREPDHETEVWRAMNDRKGSVAATLKIGPYSYTIRHSKRRVDSYDLSGGTLAKPITGGRVVIGLALGRLLP